MKGDVGKDQMKKRLYNVNYVLLAALALALTLPGAFCYARRGAKAAPSQNTPKTTPYWAVGSADTSGNTITLQKSDGSTNLTLSVTAATKITVSGKPGKLADLQSGMKVAFSASGNTCSKLDAVAAPATQQKKKGKNNNS